MHDTPPSPADRRLIEQVHPPGWANPTPADRYDLVVIGAGTAGLVCAAGAAGLGARVALVERHLLGGDCLNYGCVPSKGFIRAARAVHDAGAAGEFGTAVTTAPADFTSAMERMRRIRADISAHDSAERFKGLGVDVFFGEGRFIAPDTAEVNGTSLRFIRAAVCTGARAAALPIAGLAEAGALTNETVFSLTALPPRLAVIGGGPIGCELAQAFARFGSRVTVLEAAGQILSREDADAAATVRTSLERDGVTFLTGVSIARVETRGSDKVVIAEHKGTLREVTVEAILVGVGRSPNVEGISLEKAGIAYDLSRGIQVDDLLRTTNRRIFAAGDICSPYRFTHAADAMARIVIANALFGARQRASALVIPWCTYTDPEVAHVGMYEHEARAKGIEVTTFTVPLAEVDRALLDGETEGFARVHLKKGTDRIAGATIVARHAGEMIGELTLAMTTGMGLGAIGRTIHPYPTQAEAVRKLADAWNRTRLTPTTKKVLDLIVRWKRLWR
ncbi:MAG: mercuric reductase [Desulfuromonadales bacterium]|nr:MAG: mercuric reductase [Desulfuromonadales bacterium]